jgi:hypothetical protein
MNLQLHRPALLTPGEALGAHQLHRIVGGNLSRSKRFAENVNLFFFRKSNRDCWVVLLVTQLL